MHCSCTGNWQEILLELDLAEFPWKAEGVSEIWYISEGECVVYWLKYLKLLR